MQVSPQIISYDTYMLFTRSSRLKAENSFPACRGALLYPVAPSVTLTSHHIISQLWWKWQTVFQRVGWWDSQRIRAPFFLFFFQMVLKILVITKLSFLLPTCNVCQKQKFNNVTSLQQYRSVERQFCEQHTFWVLSPFIHERLFQNISFPHMA